MRRLGSSSPVLLNRRSIATLRVTDISPMAIELIPLPLPASVDASRFTDFGREVKGVNPGALTPEEFKEVQDALYKVRSTIQTV